MTAAALAIVGLVCIAAVVAAVVLVAVGGTALSALPFVGYVHTRWFRKEPTSTATSYSLDQMREAGEDEESGSEEVPEGEGANRQVPLE